jgi:hypothetical protein
LLGFFRLSKTPALAELDIPYLVLSPGNGAAACASLLPRTRGQMSEVRMELTVASLPAIAKRLCLAQI